VNPRLLVPHHSQSHKTYQILRRNRTTKGSHNANIHSNETIELATVMKRYKVGKNNLSERG
jgi:hypothetical protein